MDGDAAIAHPVIVLAAGAGSRVGTPKGLVTVGEQPWLCCQLERLGECGASRAIVVLGHAWDAYVAAIPWILRARELGGFTFGGVRVEIAKNEAPERGPFSSLVCGIDAVGEGSAAFVLPIDVPCAGMPVWTALSDALTLSADVDAALPTHDGRGGHPVILSSRMLARLRALPLDASDARLDAQLRALPDGARARVIVDDVRVTMNLNTKADWESITGGGGDVPRDR